MTEYIAGEEDLDKHSDSDDTIGSFGSQVTKMSRKMRMIQKLQNSSHITLDKSVQSVSDIYNNEPEIVLKGISVAKRCM